MRWAKVMEKNTTEKMPRKDSAATIHWAHKILNVLDKLPKREQAQAKLLLCRIPYSQSRKEAERLRSIFSNVVPRTRPSGSI